MTANRHLLLNEDGGLIVETALLLVFLSMAGYLALQAFGGTVAGHATSAEAAFHQIP